MNSCFSLLDTWIPVSGWTDKITKLSNVAYGRAVGEEEENEAAEEEVAKSSVLGDSFSFRTNSLVEVLKVALPASH